MPQPSPMPPWVILASRFHGVVVARLVEGARNCLAGKGLSDHDIALVQVAGAFELPQALAALVRRDEAGAVPRGVVALGCVVRGETPHFEHVCTETSHGLIRAAMDGGVALGFGLLTCDTMEQALARAGGEAGNKGWEAAEAAWDLAGTLERIARLRSGDAN